jgi:hypothetical protein
MSIESNKILLRKAHYIRLGTEEMLQAVIENENPTVDPIIALDEIAIFLKNYVASLKAMF